MKAQEFKRGEVTAFLALIFVLLVSFAGSLMESASLQTAKSYRRADMNRAIESVFAEYQRELLEEFDIFSLEGSYESGTYDEKKLVDRLSYYGASGMKQKIGRIELLTDKNGKSFLEQIDYYIESKYGLSSLINLHSSMDIWKKQEEKEEHIQQLETELDQQLSEMLSENGLELPIDGNPLPNMQNLAATPLVDLVMPAHRTVSEKAAATDSMVSHRSLRKGYGDFSDVTEGTELSAIAFGEYILTHFSSAVPKEGEKKDGSLDYEIEYILSGKDSDRENLETVLRKLLIFRFVPNYAYLQGDSARQAEVKALALTLCSVIALPAAADALAQVLLFAWAFGESIMDLRSLIEGGGVPITKNSESWQLSLSGLMTLGTEGENQEGKNTSEGITYDEYLRVLLFLNHKQEMSLRALDMIELCLRKEKGLSWFRADNCISRMEVESTVNLRRGITYRFHTYYGYR